MNFIVSIIKQYKYQLLFIYFYILLSQLILLAEPYVLGKCIDGLLKREFFWLYIFLAMFIISNVFMYKRMVFDTKIYTKIYNDIVFRYFQNDKTSSISTKNARTDMAHEIITFLESYVHYYIMSILTLFGSLFFIFIEHIPTGFVVLSCTFPIIFIVFCLYKKIDQATKVGNSHYEQKMDCLKNGLLADVKSFYNRRAKVIIAGSTIQAKNWFALNTTKSIFLILALIVFTSREINLTQGQAIAMYTYINNFLISLLTIPIGMENFSRMKDIIKRIKFII